MINHDHRNIFLKKHAARCSPEMLFKQYEYFYWKYSQGEISKVESLYNCAWYLSRLLSDFQPAEIIRAIYKVEGSDIASISRNDEEFVYVYLMRQMALLELYHDNFSYSALWAKKTLDMVNYFHPHLNTNSTKRVIEKSFNYLDCQRILQETMPYFNLEYFERNMVFKWEKNIHFPGLSANENSN